MVSIHLPGIAACRFCAKMTVGKFVMKKVDHVEESKTMKNDIKKQPMANRATSSKRGESEMKMTRESRNYASFSPKLKIMNAKK